MLLPKLKRSYTNLALLVFNTLLLCLGLNGLIWLVETIYPSFGMALASKDQVASVYNSAVEQLIDFEVFQQIYPSMSDGEIIRLRLESWNVPFICDPDTMYREKPLQTAYITVDPAGVRQIKEQGPWPPSDEGFIIFVFGGSTTFGYGEADEYTIPSYLQQYLRAKFGESVFVYNFGHASFFSLQERLAFEALLRDGFVPDLAIFIDGLNDFFYWDGQPAHHACNPSVGLGTDLVNTIACHDDEWCWPMQRLITRIITESNSNRIAPRSEAPPPYDVATNTNIIKRWVDNKDLIEATAAAHNVQTLFVLQPVPGYAYDLDYHPFAETDINHIFMNDSRYKWGYAIWEEMALADAQIWTANFLNLSHLGETKQEILYLDRVHYTRIFMDEIARNIANSLIAYQSLTQPPDSATDRATDHAIVINEETLIPKTIGDNVVALGSTPLYTTIELENGWQQLNPAANFSLDKNVALVRITTNNSRNDPQFISNPIALKQNTIYLVKFALQVESGGVELHVLEADQQTPLASFAYCAPQADFVEQKFTFNTAGNREVYLLIRNCAYPEATTSTFWFRDLEIWEGQSVD